MYDPTPPMSCVDTSVRVSKKIHRAATTSGSRRSAHIAADRCVQAATTLRRMAIRKLRTVWTGDSEEDLDGYLSEYSASIHRPVSSVVHARCEGCGSAKFGVRKIDYSPTSHLLAMV